MYYRLYSRITLYKSFEGPGKVDVRGFNEILIEIDRGLVLL